MNISLYTLVCPNGSQTERPTVAQLEVTFSSALPTFWLTGSFDAGLYHGPTVGRVGLIFMPDVVAMSFVIAFTDEAGEVVLSRDGNGTGNAGTVTIQPGGQAFSVPLKWAVDPQVALDAARAFLEEPRRPEIPGHHWDARWRYHPKGEDA